MSITKHKHNYHNKLTTNLPLLSHDIKNRAATKTVATPARLKARSIYLPALTSLAIIVAVLTFMLLFGGSLAALLTCL